MPTTKKTTKKRTTTKSKKSMKQIQRVNVHVTPSGGGGGGIFMSQPAPQTDFGYHHLSQAVSSMATEHRAALQELRDRLNTMPPEKQYKAKPVTIMNSLHEHNLGKSIETSTDDLGQHKITSFFKKKKLVADEGTQMEYGESRIAKTLKDFKDARMKGDAYPKIQDPRYPNNPKKTIPGYSGTGMTLKEWQSTQ